ncbi:MAG: hypothetical protein NUW22_14605 [Acidobacteria bacterium]|nr:hypothetical protein [Acidobacteriota bacterium]
MPDPIVAEPVTAAAPSDAPDMEAPDSGPMVAPPTAERDAPEPEAQPDPIPEGPNYEELLAALGDDALRELGPVKSLVARESESMRRKTERAAAAESFTATQQYAGSEAVLNELADAAREAAENLDDYGRPTVSPEKISKASNAVLARGVAVGVNMLSRYLEEQAGETFTLTKAEQEQIEAAQVLYHQKPLDPTPLFRSWLVPFGRAQQEALREQIRTELTPEIRREEQERIKAAAAEAAGEARAGAPSPTPLNGASPSMAAPPADLKSFIGISAALRRGQINDEQAQKAYSELQ